MITAEDLIHDNLRLVHYVANRYRVRANHLCVEMDDLIGAGNIGLVLAAKRFDPQKGFMFATYAVPMINGMILQHLRDKSGTIKIPRTTRDLLQGIKMRDLLDESPEDIATQLGCRVDQAQHALIAHQVSVTSLDTVIVDDGSLTIVDLVGDRDDDTSLFVSDFIDSLKPVDRVIVQMLLSGAKQREIALKTGLVQSYVSRLIKRIGERYLALA